VSSVPSFAIWQKRQKKILEIESKRMNREGEREENTEGKRMAITRRKMKRKRKALKSQIEMEQK